MCGSEDIYQTDHFPTSRISTLSLDLILSADNQNASKQDAA